MTGVIGRGEPKSAAVIGVALGFNRRSETTGHPIDAKIGDEKKSPKRNREPKMGAGECGNLTERIKHAARAGSEPAGSAD